MSRTTATVGAYGVSRERRGGPAAADIVEMIAGDPGLTRVRRRWAMPIKRISPAISPP
jgi:hypothetical protein